MPCAHAPHVPESQRPTLPTVPHRQTIHTSRALNPQRLDPLVMANRSSPHKGTALSYIDTLSALRPAPSSTVRDPRRPAGLGSCPTRTGTLVSQRAQSTRLIYALASSSSHTDVRTPTRGGGPCDRMAPSCLRRARHAIGDSPVAPACPSPARGAAQGVKMSRNERRYQ